MQTVLVTGATGFLGSYLVKALCKSNYRVKALRRSNSSLSRLHELENKIEWFNSETGGVKDFEDFFAGVDSVIHTAVTYGRSGESNSYIIETNVLYGLKVLTASLNQSVKLFINTDTALPKETNSYSRSKAQFAERGKFLVPNTQTQFLNIKLEHMYGPGDDEGKFIDFIVNACVNNQPIIKLTEGSQQRDFIYISDVVAAYLLLLQKQPEFEKNYLDISLGSNSIVEIRELAEMIHRMTRSKSELFFGAIPVRENEVMYSCADISALKKMGWMPRVSLEEGVRLTVESKRK